MLQIAVCEDEAEMLDYLEKSGSEYVACKVCRFQDGSELTDSGQEFDILLAESEEEGGTDRKLTLRVRQELMDVWRQNREVMPYGKEKEPVLVRANGTYYRIEREKVLYVENEGRKVVLHMKNSQISYYAKMKETEELLGSQFFRCHRGYLVNLKAVKSYESGSILLKNGERILMAKQKYNDFAAAYAEYLRNKS